MKTLLGLLVVGFTSVGAFAQDAGTAALLQALKDSKDPSTSAHARAMLANPITPGESRDAWQDRLARAEKIEARTWSAEDEKSYATRYAARLQAEADARRLAAERERDRLLIDAIDANTAARLQRR